MTHVVLLGSLLLLPLFLSSNNPSPYADLTKAENEDHYMCGSAKITTDLRYCSIFKKCDKAGIIRKAKDFVDEKGNFAICDKKNKHPMEVQVLVNEKPDVWKKVSKISCENKGADDGTVKVQFKNPKLAYNEGMQPKEFKLRCVADGRASFDVYDFKRFSGDKQKEEEGVYKNERFYIVFTFIALLLTLTIMCAHYLVYLIIENERLLKSVTRKQVRHDELWLSIERRERSVDDFEEEWAAMPLIHQQVAIEAAFFLQKYKDGKFTVELRQWIFDRGFPPAATEMILFLAGLSEPVLPFYAPDERLPESKFKNEHKLIEYGERIESRITDTLNYANRLRRRKIVFTDHRWLELHHFLFELFLTTLGSPSHPTIYDASIPALPRHAFGTRDDPVQEEKEQMEIAARMKRPHFLHHDWDEAQRLLGSEA